MRLSKVLAWLTFVQGIWTLGLALGWWRSAFFTVQHEDYIFIAHLMTWFIVSTIENIKIIITENVNIKEI